MSSTGPDGLGPVLAFALSDAGGAIPTRELRPPAAMAAAPRGGLDADGVSPALEHAVRVRREGEDADGGATTFPLSPEAVEHLARRFSVPAWLGGTRAEADLVEAHQRTCDLAAEFKALSANALALRATARRVQHNVLAARFAPLDALPVAVALLSAQRIVSANDALARTLGCDRATLEGAPWLSVFGADAAPLDAVFAEGTPQLAGSPPAPVTVRVRVTSSEGTPRWYTLDVGPVRQGLAYCVVRADATAVRPVPPPSHME